MSLRDVTFDEAREEMRSRAPLPDPEVVPLDALVGRRLARDLRARIDNPAFTNSAMDGFALRAAEAAGGAPLRIVGESRAGAPFVGAVGAGEAIRISTGAVLPDALDAILRREDAAEADGHVVATVPPSEGMFVRRRAEDSRRGDLLLPASHHVRAHEIAAIAAMGIGEALCDRRLRVTVLGSGDEVVSHEKVLQPGQVYDANRSGISAQAITAGADVLTSGVMPDERGATIAAIRAALDADPAPDLLITTGGVSVGRHDHLRPAFEALGVRETLFGVRDPPGPSALARSTRLAGRARPPRQPGERGGLLPRLRPPAPQPRGRLGHHHAPRGHLREADPTDRADPLHRGRRRPAPDGAPGLS